MYSPPPSASPDWSIRNGEREGIDIYGPNGLRVHIIGKNLHDTIMEIYDVDLRQAIDRNRGRPLSIEEIKRIFFMGFAARISGRLAGNLFEITKLAPLVNIFMNQNQNIPSTIMTGVAGTAQSVLNQIFRSK